MPKCYNPYLVSLLPQGIDLDDWLSDSEESDKSDNSEGENIEESGESLIRWSTIALDERGEKGLPSASRAAALPADLAAKCQENASRRQKIQKLLGLRKKNGRGGDGTSLPREATSGTEPTSHSTGDQGSQMPQQGRQKRDSDSDDEMENLYKNALKAQAKLSSFRQNNSIPRIPFCIRFNPNHKPDLELSNSSRQVPHCMSRFPTESSSAVPFPFVTFLAMVSFFEHVLSRAVAPHFAGFRSGATTKPKTTRPEQASEVRAPNTSSESRQRQYVLFRRVLAPTPIMTPLLMQHCNACGTLIAGSGFSGLLTRLVNPTKSTNSR